MTGGLFGFCRRFAESSIREYQEWSMGTMADQGIVDKPSDHSVDQTVEKLQGILQAKGVKLFALIDHSGEAEKVGMKNASDQAVDLRKPQSWNAFEAGSS
jgi:hypothetical protein